MLEHSRRLLILIFAIPLLFLTLPGCEGDRSEPADETTEEVLGENEINLDSLTQRAEKRIESMVDSISQNKQLEQTQEDLEEIVSGARERIDALADSMEDEGAFEEAGERIDRFIADVRNQIREIAKDTTSQ